MTDQTERTLGYGFGLIGGILVLVGALVTGVVSLIDLILGHSLSAVNSASEAVVLLVIGALALFFSYTANRGWKDRPIASGVLLVVLAAVGWGVLGLGGSLPALVGALFVFLAGVLYLVVPVRSGITSLASA